MSDTKKNNILARATAQFDAKRLIPIEVPEWPDEDGKPAIVYCRPLSIKNRVDIRREVKGDMESPEVFAATVRLCALDRDGNKLFSLDDKHALMHSIDPDVLRRVALQMLYPAPADDPPKN